MKNNSITPLHFVACAAPELPPSKKGYAIKVVGKVDIRAFNTKVRDSFAWMKMPHYVYPQSPISSDSELWSNKRKAYSSIQDLKRRKEYGHNKCQLFVVDCKGEKVKIWK